MQAFVLIQAEHDGTPLARRLMEVPGVAFAENITGAYDAIALAGAASTRQLFESVIARILELPGVTRALPAPLIRSVAEHPDTESGSLDRVVGSGDRAA